MTEFSTLHWLIVFFILFAMTEFHSWRHTATAEGGR